MQRQQHHGCQYREREEKTTAGRIAFQLPLQLVEKARIAKSHKSFAAEIIVFLARSILGLNLLGHLPPSVIRVKTRHARGNRGRARAEVLVATARTGNHRNEGKVWGRGDEGRLIMVTSSVASECFIATLEVCTHVQDWARRSHFLVYVAAGDHTRDVHKHSFPRCRSWVNRSISHVNASEAKSSPRQSPGSNAG
jgi:hypothetical protein